MRILGIDTTTRFLNIGLLDRDRVLEYRLETGVRLSGLLTVTIERILGAMKWSAADIDYLACGLGPGSFTGIRIGLAAIKGMAWPLNKKIAGLPTLDVIAGNVPPGRHPVAVAIDAKRNLIYCALYKFDSGTLRKVSAYMLLSVEDFCRKVKPGSLITGDAAGIYRDVIKKNVRSAVILDSDYWYPKGHNIISLAVEKIKRSKLNTHFDIKPIYLYPKDCQVKTKGSK